MADEKSCKGLSKSTTLTCFFIVAAMAFFPLYEYLAADYFRILMARTFVFSFLIVMFIIPFIGYMFLKSFKKVALLFVALCLVIYGELHTFIDMQKNVPESYYKDMTTILQDKKIPVSLKKYLYDASSDGVITYREWLIFSTRYDLFLTTHEKDLDIDQREQERFLRARERVVM